MEENELERTESGKIATINAFGIYPTYKIYRSLDIKNRIYIPLRFLMLVTLF